MSFAQIYQAYSCYNWQIPKEWDPYRLEMSKEAIQFAVQSGVTNEVKYYCIELDEEIPAYSFGNQAIVINPNYLPQGIADKELSDAMNVVMRHEYTHIINNDMFVRSALRATVSLACGILGMAAMTPLSALFLNAIGSVASHILYSRFIENRADDVAIQNSTESELNASLAILRKQIQARVDARKNSVLERILYSPEGDHRFEIIHPPFTVRAKKIELALTKLH